MACAKWRGSARFRRQERQHIFFPHALAQRTTQWERGNDPMTQFTFTDDYDPYGQPRSQISIAVPRGRDFRVTATTPSEPYLATQSVTDYAQRDDAQVFIVDRVSHTTSYEIVNDGRPALLDLKTAIDNGTAVRPHLCATSSVRPSIFTTARRSRVCLWVTLGTMGR